MKYSFDVYRFEIEKEKECYSLNISNVISWDFFAIKLSESEIKGLIDFLNGLELNNQIQEKKGEQ